jgi:hypothetical protein
MRKYPDAAQVPEARERYNALLYNTHTGDERLDSYVRFVKNNPDSPFRTQAERNIYEIITADNAIESYLRFIREYPESPVVRRCYDFLYHRYKHTASAEAFLNRFGNTLPGDSLRRIAMADERYVIPIFEMGQYGFIRDNGAKLIDFKYSDIEEKYLCGHVTSDFLEVWDEARHQLISRLGDVILEGSFEEVTDIGSGLLKIEKAGFYGLVHKSGRQLMEYKYQDLDMAGSAFVKFQFNGKWGLMSLSGRQILPPQYDDIFAEGHFVVIESGGLYDVQNVDNLSRAANHQEVTIDCKYDDFELVNEDHMLLFAGDMEAVIDKSLTERIPLAKQKIYELFSGWYVEQDGLYRIYDQVFYLVSPLQFQYLEHKGRKMALKYGNKWAVYNIENTFPVSFPYDSVQLLSDEIAILRRGVEVYAGFSSDTLVNISDAEEVRLLADYSISEDDGPRPSYLLIETDRNTYKAYNVDGQPILSGRYSSVEALGREYLLVERSGKKGLYHKSGATALKTQYAAIGNYQDGYVSTLLNGKFGIYNYDRDLLLSAKYEKRLRPYGNEYFVGIRNDKSAIIDKENKNVTGFIFDNILYWNDTSALVSEDGRWYVYDIKGQTTAYDDIDQYKVLDESDVDKILLITRQGKVGILSSFYGEIIGPTFNDVVNVGSAENPVYFAEKYIPEAEFYVVIYYDSRGKILRKQVFNREEYDNIYCG